MGGVERRGRFLIAADYPVLEASFVREVKAIREHESFEPLLILVSSKLLGLHLQRLLAEEGLSHFNLRFWTLEEFAREISAPNFLAQGKRELPPYADELIVEDLAKSFATKTEEFYFRDIADRPGFHKAISATIKDLKDGCLLPDDLERFLSKTKLSKPVHLSKLRDLLKLWKGYQERLEAIKGYDQSDLMVFAAQWAEKSIFLKQTPKILIYGFYDFNTAQKRFLQACFTLKETIAFLPYEPTSAFEYVKPTFTWFKEAGFKEIEPVRPALPVRSQSLDHLSFHLFSDHKPFKYEPKEIEMISTPGEAREVRELVRVILQESATEGIPFHEIGILLRTPEEYCRLFRETFHSLGIDPYIREGIPLIETRAGRSLKLLLSVIHQNFSRSSVMEFTTFAKLRRKLFSNERDFEKKLARWDALSIRAGIVEGEEEWEERLRRLKLDWLKKLDSEEEEEGKRRFYREDLASLDQLIQFVQKLFRFGHQVVGAHTWRLKIEALIHTFDELVEEDEEGLLVKQTIRSLSDLDDLRITPSQEDFLRLVNQILEERVIPHGRFQRKGPTIVHLMAARGVPFKMVLLPGMVEKSFPPLIRQDAILLDQERMAINRFLSGRKNDPLPLKAEGRLREERLLFRLAVGSARDKLILSYPRIENGTGKERLPSSFLLSLIKALTRRSVDFNQIEAFSRFRRIPLSEIATKRPEEAIDEVEFDLSIGQEKLSTKNADHLLYLGQLSPLFRKGLRLEYSRWGKRGFTHYDGFLDSEESQQILRDHYSILRRSISPTRLETYASCPFQYFLSGILGIEGLTEPEKETTITPLDKGKLVHDLLYAFYSELKKERGRSFQFIPEDLKRLIEIAEKKFLEFEETGVIGYPMFWEVEKREMMEQLKDFFNDELRESEYLPAYFEVRYGMKAFDFQESEISTEQPLSLPLKGEVIHLKGRIDRIDLTRDGKKARVRDYKTGSVSAKPNDFQGGRTLQLPLYLYAARQLLHPLYEGIRVEIAEYCFLRERKRVSFEESKLNEKEGELQEILETLARGIEHGIFIAVPDNQGCKYRSCNFRTICGTWTPILFDRKFKDPKVKRFLEVTRQLAEEAEE